MVALSANKGPQGSNAMTKENTIMGIVFAVALAAGIVYLYWLDAGCAHNGIMTWAGKQCM